MEARTEALREAIEWMIRPSREWAYRRCCVCGCTWWGEHPDYPKRGRLERERHNLDCPVPRWRAALSTPTSEVSDG